MIHKLVVLSHFISRSSDSRERCGLPWCAAQCPGCTISSCSIWRQESETLANVTHLEQSFPDSDYLKENKVFYAGEWQHKSEVFPGLSE